MHLPPKPRGFTLIEAGATLAVVAVAATTAVPGLQELLARQRLEGVAAELAVDLQTLRTEAVARNESLVLSLHADAGGSCYLMHSGAKSLCSCSSAAPPACSGAATLLKAVRLPAGSGPVVSASAGAIRFDPVHGTSTPAATVRVAGAAGTVHHVVNVMGRVRSCSPEGRIAGYRAC